MLFSTQQRMWELKFLAFAIGISGTLSNVDEVETDGPHVPVSKKIPRPDCYGTHVGFGSSGGPEYHYESLIKRYKGCTHVEGNLEIANLGSSANISYDLSFLSTIEVVTGYVLLGLLDVEVIPLTSLKYIRADNTYEIMGEQYGLVVALTTEYDTNGRTGLRELQLPALREISRGRVLFQNNPLLCYVDTVVWEAIVPGKHFPVMFGENAHNQNCDQPCDSECEVQVDITSLDGTEIERKGHCWGQGKDMCQIVHTPICDSFCPGRCFRSGIMGCCHPECAVGCYGPSDTECMMCKYFKYEDKCVPRCPSDVSFREGQLCKRYYDNSLPDD